MIISIVLIIAGTWFLSDAVYSITLYFNAPSYEGSSKQTWKRDHWVRLMRGFLAIVVIVCGVLLYD